MPRYIDGEKLRNRISAEYTNCTQEFVKGFSEAFRLWNEELERMMNEESNVQEVKRGKWINDFYNDYHCSECGAEAPNDGYDCGANYCYNCGAKMDGEGEK